MNGRLVSNEITWVSVLRILACVLVVLAHSADPFTAGNDPAGFSAAAFLGTITRVSVPLFIMLSGVLLLPTKLSVGEFYSRRLRRVLIPFIFWSIVSPVLFYVLVQLVDTVSPTIAPEAHTLSQTLKAMYLWVFNFSFSTIPYWYIYMMLGVYLAIPVISGWVREASRRDMEIVLCLWLFSTIVPYLQLLAPVIGYEGNYGSMGIFGECSWNLFTTFHYVSGFLGYALLAHYLVRFPLLWSFRRVLLVGSLVWLLGFLITLYGFHYTRDNFPEDFNMLEIIWSFTSLNVVMMTVPFFVIFQKINFHQRGWVSRLSDSCYGIFLVHFVVVYAVYEFVFQRFVFISSTPFVQILLITIISFTLSALFVRFLRLIPFFRRKY